GRGGTGSGRRAGGGAGGGGGDPSGPLASSAEADTPGREPLLPAGDAWGYRAFLHSLGEYRGRGAGCCRLSAAGAVRGNRLAPGRAASADRARGSERRGQV